MDIQHFFYQNSAPYIITAITVKDIPSKNSFIFEKKRETTLFLGFLRAIVISLSLVMIFCACVTIIHIIINSESSDLIILFPIVIHYLLYQSIFLLIFMTRLLILKPNINKHNR